MLQVRGFFTVGRGYIFILFGRGLRRTHRFQSARLLSLTLLFIGGCAWIAKHIINL